MGGKSNPSHKGIDSAVLKEFNKYSVASDDAKRGGDLNGAIRFQFKAVEALTGKTGKFDFRESREFAVAAAKLGMLYLDSKDISTGRVRLLESLAVRRTLFKRLNTIESARDLCYCLNCLGVLEITVPDYVAAEKYFKEMADLALKIVQEGESPQNLRDLSLAYLRLGDLEKAKKKDLDTLTYFHMCFETDQKILKMEPSAQAKKDLALSAARTARAMVMVKSHKEAELFFETAQKLTGDVFKESKCIPHARAYVDALTEYYDYQAAAQNTDKMLVALADRAEAEFYAYEITQNPETLHHYSITIAKSGDIFYGLGNFKNALVFYKKMAEIAQINHEALGNDATLGHWALAKQKQGAASIELRDLHTAKALLAESFKLYKKIALANKNHPACQHQLSIAYQWMAILEKALGNTLQAMKYINLDIKITRSLITQFGQNVLGKDLATSLSRLGQFHLDQGDTAKALACYRENHELNRQAFAADFNAQNIADLTISKVKIAETTNGSERADFIRTAKEGVELLEKHYPHHPKLEILKKQVAVLGN